MIRDLVQIENQLDKIQDNPDIDYGKLKTELTQDLKWHIHNNNNNGKYSAINIATDYCLEELVPDIAVQLNDPDEMIREISIANLIGRFERSEYAEIGLDMAKNDSDDSVQLLACSNLGFILPKIQNNNLKREISEYLINMLFDHPAV
jgi:hypothetical protein